MITFNKLKSKYENTSDIPYVELIKTKEWFDRRESILERDGSKCSKCTKSSTSNYYDSENNIVLNLWYGEEKFIYAKNISGELKVVDSYIPIFQADKPYTLHVHHKLYILDKLPWEYLDDDLVVLCNWCHWEFHLNNIVPVFKTINDKLEQLDFTPCSRCNGAGWFPEYTHIQGGICFRCSGKRYEELI